MTSHIAGVVVVSTIICLLLQSCTKDSGPIQIIPDSEIDTISPPPPPPPPDDTNHVITNAVPVRFVFSENDTTQPPPANDTVSFSSIILPIFQSKCAFCHPPSGDLDLSDSEAHAQLVNITSSGYAPSIRVTPYDTVASVLYHKIIDDGQFDLIMPPYGTPLTEGEKVKINKWIVQGALDN